MSLIEVSSLELTRTRPRGSVKFMPFSICDCRVTLLSAGLCLAVNLGMFPLSGSAADDNRSALGGGIHQAPAPLFRDPVHDGAADATLIWNRAEKCWWMLYTNRRADAANEKGVKWVHGTDIGIASTPDGGATWN
jgi:hypothetical protein